MSEQAAPPHDGLARTMVNALPKLRSWAGPIIADHLRATPPEDRTWVDGAIVGGLSITDKIDGIWARRLGETAEGAELDKRADVDFIESQQEARVDNGEISSTHLKLKYVREYAMEETRIWGAEHGKNTKSLQSGRHKTAREMATQTAANSPLAQRPNLIRWGDSMSTSKMLTSYADVVFDYMKKDDADTTETARNSEARKRSAGHITKLAGLVHRTWPELKPSHITYAGKRLVEGASLAAFIKPDHPVLPTTVYTIGSLFDTLDGALARLLGEVSYEGEEEDIKADLEQQLAALTALGGIALKRGNMVAATNYAMAIMTTALVSSARAEAESKGFIVAEGGIGTRLGRGITVGVGMGLNRHKDAADIVSATLADGNITTIRERRHVAKYGLESPYCKGVDNRPEFMENAAKRREAIRPYAEAGLLIGSTLLAYSAPKMAARA